MGNKSPTVSKVLETTANSQVSLTMNMVFEQHLFVAHVKTLLSENSRFVKKEEPTRRFPFFILHFVDYCIFSEQPILLHTNHREYLVIVVFSLIPVIFLQISSHNSAALASLVPEV